MKNVKEMSYKELENEVINISKELFSSNDLNKKRVLINRSHDCMVEMDRRWESGQMKTKVKTNGNKSYR